MAMGKRISGQAGYDVWKQQYGVVNVKDFGALGDGSQDDTLAIQMALSSIPTGGILFFPIGFYVITKNVWVPSGVRVLGSSFGSTQALPAKNSVIRVDNGSFILQGDYSSIDGIQIDGSANIGSSPAFQVSGGHCSIGNLYVWGNFVSPGVYLGSAGNVIANLTINNLIVEQGYPGITLNATQSTITFMESISAYEVGVRILLDNNSINHLQITNMKSETGTPILLQIGTSESTQAYGNTILYTDLSCDTASTAIEVNYPIDISNGQDPNMMFQVHVEGSGSIVHNNGSYGSLVARVSSGKLGASLAISPPASPLVSGTVYQNTNTMPIAIYQPAYATTAGTAGNIAVALGATNTPSAIYTKFISGGSSSTATVPCNLTVPPGWWYSFTTTGATLANATVIEG